MFSQPTPTPASSGLGETTTPASPTSSSRTSRLRGLSYLRSYTTQHLLSRESAHNNAQTTNAASGPTASVSTISATTTTTGTGIGTPSSSSAASRSDYFTTVIVDNTNDNPSSSARNRLSQLVPTLSQRTSVSENTIMTRARSSTTGNDQQLQNKQSAGPMDVLPSIRFSSFHDPRATRPSLKFQPISRTLPSGSEIIRVGRYSERDNQPNVPINVPSAAPVGFKSKVVSRRHCEFWYEDGKWYIKDVKSSSGTFLNHIRLSPPGTESKPFVVNDGDIVQLGIDFKGGEEMIFRCVKMRLELNRGWQNKLNAFNLNTHKRLRNMTAGSGQNGASQSYSQDCSICLNSIAPCQCLFVAPCSHTWHYKCIRSLLSSPSYPIFICPNCRAAADLEAEVEDPEDWEQLDSDEGQNQEGASLQPDSQAGPAAPRRSKESVRSAVHAPQRGTSQQPALPSPAAAQQHQEDVVMVDSPLQISRQVLVDIDTGFLNIDANHPMFSGVDTLAINHPNAVTVHPPSNSVNVPGASAANPIAIPSPTVNSDPGLAGRNARTPSPTGAPVTNGQEGPITPRNDAGPWVFDGSDVRLSADGSHSDPTAPVVQGSNTSQR
ncbi:hypothetical protein QBC38DRAFT_223533 [Podospora fimiseda]|uniref:RING-type E3 ubiquitin transferase n=1 Tax=Podospora fimiseda TaxID=252190 RepID=A0AAN7BYV4_9PEZI|nr:hypothetical protein QBC38DRAFT_223533 [Podospora fimiseda]